jgi:phage terminase large subunit-like protein
VKIFFFKSASFGWLKFRFHKIFAKLQVSNKNERFSKKKTGNKKLAKTREDGSGFQENRMVFDEIEWFFDKTE